MPKGIQSENNGTSVFKQTTASKSSQKQKGNIGKKGSTAASETVFLNATLIIQVLKDHSSREHPLTATRIAEILNKTYYGISKGEPGGLSAKTVTRQLDRLLDNLNIYPAFTLDYDDDEYDEDYEYDPEKKELDPNDLKNNRKTQMLFDIGYQLHCVIKGKNGYEPYPFNEDEDDESWDDNGKKPRRYYYYESNLTEEEIRIIFEALEAYNYLGVKDISLLFQKLSALRPANGNSYDTVFKDRPFRGDESDLFRIVRRLGKIMSHNKEADRNRKKKYALAKITYGNYKPVKGKIDLAERKGYPKLLRPIKLLFANGYFYLVVYNTEREYPFHLRIDRIMDVEMAECTKNEFQKYIHEENGGNAGSINSSKISYRTSRPIMFSGSVEEVHMVIRATEHNGILNAIVDLFGRNAKIRPIEDGDLKLLGGTLPKPVSGEDETWYSVTVDSTPGGMVLFAKEYCENVVILSPSEIAKEVQQKLLYSASLYGDSLRNQIKP